MYLKLAFFENPILLYHQIHNFSGVKEGSRKHLCLFEKREAPVKRYRLKDDISYADAGKGIDVSRKLASVQKA